MYKIFIRGRGTTSWIGCRTALALFGAVLISTSAHAQPWRLNNAVALPDWLSLSGSFRLRYESLDEQFRAFRDGGDQIFLLRTLLHAQAKWGAITFGAELQDSRQELADAGTPLSTSVVNTTELLRAYLNWQTTSLGGSDIASDMTVGRLTMDIGSRRFVARNRFRNTLNAFTGVDWSLNLQNGQHVRAFFVLPVNRRPVAPTKLLANETEFDDEHTDVKFWGVYWRAENVFWGDSGEIFVFGLHEDDSASLATRNRELITIGFRFFRPAARGNFDYQIENAFQFGESRSTVLARPNLDHFAHFHHAELGFTFDSAWNPRLLAQFDYASGDDSQSDDDNNRFDTLFGSRRFDFGPTGQYGPFARSNVITPGLRLLLKPTAATSAFVAHRVYWLASARDAWTSARVIDPSGSSGRYLGHQIDVRMRHELLPGNVRIEAGVAHLFKGEFAEDAPNANDNGDPTYIYGQIALTF